MIDMRLASRQRIKQQLVRVRLVQVKIAPIIILYFSNLKYGWSTVYYHPDTNHLLFRVGLLSYTEALNYLRRGDERT